MSNADVNWLPRNAPLIPTPGRWLERGVAAPFTTPALVGARLRRLEGGPLDVLLPNPAGREGWFVLPWPAVREAHHPTLADQALVMELAPADPACAPAQPPSTPSLTPARLRAVALRVADGGLGGRGLRRAALAVGAAQARRELALRARLERHGLRAPAHSARFLAPGLETVEGSWDARLRGLAELAAELREAASQAPTPDDQLRMQRLSHRAESLAAPLAGLITAAREALLARLDEPPLRAAEPPELARPDWLLEGWDLLAALLRMATAGEERLRVLRRAGNLLPPLPAEALGWPGCAGLPMADALPPDPGGLAPGSTARLEAGLAAWLEPPA